MSSVGPGSKADVESVRKAAYLDLMSSAAVAKKVVVNAQGTPVEVILSWKSFQQIAEALGWDLSAEAKADMRATRRDLARRDSKAFVPLSSL